MDVSETVTRAVYTPTTNAHGAPVDAWGAPASVGIYGFDPGSSSEPRLPGQDRLIVEPTILMPSSAVWGHRDKIVARGKTYEVEGATRDWVHPTEGAIGNVVTLRAVTG